MNRSDILKKCIDLTMGDRNKAYGDPTANHTNISSLWNCYLQIRSKSGKAFDVMMIDAEDVEIMMALVKIARIAQRLTADPDHYIDAATYIAMAGEARLHNKVVSGNKYAVSTSGGNPEGGNDQ